MKLDTLIELIKDPMKTGTVAESSRFLARKMAHEVKGTTTNIVEFGPGTGSITREILKKLPQNGRLTCFEVNRTFCKQLSKIEDNRLKVINDGAQNCHRYVEKPDCVISCLPLTLFSKSLRQEIISVSSKSGTYVQFLYTPFLGKKLKQYFKEVKIKFVLLNIPPAFVYVCRNPRSDIRDN